MFLSLAQGKRGGPSDSVIAAYERDKSLGHEFYGMASGKFLPVPPRVHFVVGCWMQVFLWRSA